MRSSSKFFAAIAMTAIVASACSGAAATTAPPPVLTNAPTDTPAAVASAPGGAAASQAASAAPLSVSSFDASFSAMAGLTSVTTAGSGMVGVILPDVTTSTRYTSYDLPYLTKAFTTAGYTADQFKIQNASGTTTTEVAIAQSMIANKAKVLLVDPLDGPTGLAIQTLAATAGIPYISYDRATFQGTTTYYISFDNVKVGKLIGQGFMDCVTAWGVKSPQVFTLDGGQD